MLLRCLSAGKELKFVLVMEDSTISAFKPDQIVSNFMNLIEMFNLDHLKDKYETANKELYDRYRQSLIKSVALVITRSKKMDVNYYLTQLKKAKGNIQAKKQGTLQN